MGDYRWNNLMEWFPNGSYRSFRGKRALRVIAALDGVLAQQDVDYVKFTALRTRVYQYRQKERELCILERDTGEEYPREWEQEARETLRELDALLEPVVAKMMELGYSLEELVR